MRCTKPGELPRFKYVGICYYCHAEYETEDAKDLQTMNDRNELQYSATCQTKGCGKQVIFDQRKINAR